ncbi:MAG TPA: hypothetical protein PKK59_11540 [Anaerolineaceae bacterium]|nr:hypothetical protein [Anaerolineaceae bacterium]
MLDSMMKIGAYRVEHFENINRIDPQAFGFYIRGELKDAAAYSRDAKAQLYAGLMMIHSKALMAHLRGIYVDVDSIENLQRPAYLQMKSDLVAGLFKRIFVLDEAAILGSAAARADLFQVYVAVGGFDLLVCKNGECMPCLVFDQV